MFHVAYSNNRMLYTTLSSMAIALTVFIPLLLLLQYTWWNNTTMMLILEKGDDPLFAPQRITQ